MPGTFAFYRDLQGGDAGDDVEQLQRSLGAAGHPTGRDRPGSFGAGTKSALRSLYRAAGYEPAENDLEREAEIAEIDTRLATEPGNGNLRLRRGTLVEQLGAKAVVAELAVVPELPAILETVAPVGATIDPGAVIATLGAGNIALSASLPTESARVLSVGATGTFVDARGSAGTATVTGIHPGATVDESRLELSAIGTLDPGATFTVRIDNPRGENAEQLLVPVAAVVLRRGRAYVYRLEDERFRQVEVEVVASSGGTAAVESVGGVPLAPGDEVRIGPS